jgi:hypothetical protein
MRPLLAALMLGCLALTGDAARAADGLDFAKLKALLPPAPDAALCFTRTYDAEHLQQHPNQKVTDLILFIKYTTLDEQDAILIARDDGGTDKQYFEYDFTLAAAVKGQAHTLYASGDCSSAEGIGCGVDCDGGGIEIEPLAEDTTLVRLKRIRMTLGCGGGSEVDLEAGEDNKVFKLTKAPPPLCESMQQEADKSLH